jgi:tRNA-splicing ligase RtcB
MAAAANYAFVNRQTIMQKAKEAFLETLDISPNDLAMRLVYDVCHNIGKYEEHQVDGEARRLFVHRKGATRAFGPGDPRIPQEYQSIGQPVLIPGDMGRYSYVLVGTEGAMKETFGSSCHGAGRQMSRKQSKKECGKRDLFAEMEKRGVIVACRSRRTLAEEMPHAYKDVSHVVDCMHHAGLSKKVVRLKPIGCVKG